MDEEFDYESNPVGPSNVAIDGGDGNDSIDILWHAEPTSSAGSRVVTQFTEHEDGSFTAVYSNNYGDGTDVLTISNIENVRIVLTNRYFFGTQTYPVECHDQIRTGRGDDYVSTSIGDDLVDVGLGTDEADGGEGIDGISKDSSDRAGNIVWNLTANTYSGPGSFTGFEWFVDLRTGSGNDRIVTTLVAGANNAFGDDTISTGAGNDIVSLFNGQDTVDLGVGSDRLIIDYRTGSFTANAAMTLNGTLGAGYSGSYVSTYSDGPTVSFAGVEHFTIYTNVSGGNGSNLVDDIVTGNGDDIVFTYISNDRIDVGRGVDTVDGGVGDDGLAKDFTGTAGDIAIDLGAGTSSAPGGITGIEYFIELITVGGDDTIVTTSVNGAGNAIGDDNIATGAGNDTVTLFDGQDTVDLGSGSDRLILDYRTSTFTSNTSLSVTGSLAAGYSGAFAGGYSLGPQTSFAGVEHITIMTNVSGGNGSNLVDNIVTGDGNDVIWTFRSSDIVDGAGGNDNIDGGEGNDSLRGGSGNDTILGGTGNDTLLDSAGDDTIDGGEGVDFLSYADATGRVVVSLALAGPQNTRGGGIDTLSGIEILDGSAFGDRIEGDASASTLNGLDGDDSLLGGDGNDVLSGGLGNDRLTGGAGVDSLRGGVGNDVYYLDDPADAGDTIVENSGEGTDTVWASFDYTLGTYAENLQLRYGDWRGTGNGSDNTIRASGGDNLLQGLAGNDLLMGGSGRDTIDGGLGNDRIFGGVGTDTLTGGAGEDRFIYDLPAELGVTAGGSDIITDLVRAQGDRINLAAIDANGAAEGDASFAFIGADAFSGTAGELRYSFQGGRTVIEMDTNGDAVGDLFLRLEGELDLLGRDFIL